MKRYRIGNDIRVKWTLKNKEGGPYVPKAGARVMLRSSVSTIEMTEITVNENVVKFTFFGAEQRWTGAYSLVLVENDGERDMVTYDVAGVFRLVQHSWQTGGKDCDCIETESVVELTSTIEIPGDPGKSAYEIAVEHGFIGTEEEWLDSLGGPPGPPGSSDITKESIETALGYRPADEAGLEKKYEKPAGGIPLTDLKVLRLKNVNLRIDDSYPYVSLSDLFHNVTDLLKVCGPTGIYDVAYTDRFTPMNGRRIDLDETEIFQPRMLLIVDSYQRSLPLEGKYEYSFSLWSQMGYTIRYTVSVNYGTFPQAGDLAKVEITRNMTQEALDDALEGKQSLINEEHRLDYSLLANTPVFYAKYGETTAAEIQAAYAAGKIILCFHKRAIYTLASDDGNLLYFGTLHRTTAKWLYCNISNNSWVEGLNSLQPASDRVTALGPASSHDKYPTAKAVVEYVGGTVGDIETLLAAI